MLSARFCLFLFISTVALAVAAPNREKRGIASSFIDPFAGMYNGFAGGIGRMVGGIPIFGIVLAPGGKLLLVDQFGTILATLGTTLDGLTLPLTGGLGTITSGLSGVTGGLGGLVPGGYKVPDLAGYLSGLTGNVGTGATVPPVVSTTTAPVA